MQRKVDPLYLRIQDSCPKVVRTRNQSWRNLETGRFGCWYLEERLLQVHYQGLEADGGYRKARSPETDRVRRLELQVRYLKDDTCRVQNLSFDSGRGLGVQLVSTLWGTDHHESFHLFFNSANFNWAYLKILIWSSLVFWAATNITFFISLSEACRKKSENPWYFEKPGISALFCL